MNEIKISQCSFIIQCYRLIKQTLLCYIRASIKRQPLYFLHIYEVLFIIPAIKNMHFIKQFYKIMHVKNAAEHT